MALGRYTEVARAANGDLIRAGEVTVLVAGSSTLAELWQDDDGTVPAPNPLLTDLASGAWSAVAESGLYDVAYPDGRIVHNVRVVGASSGGGDAVAWDDIADKPETFPPTIGATGTTAAPGNHTHTGLLTGAAAEVNNSTAEDAPGLVADFNALLVALRARGIITGT